jgi:HAMP domain-containing protein
VRAVAELSRSFQRFGAGDFATPARALTNDEIGDIARAAEVFRQTLVDADAARGGPGGAPARLSS